MIVQKEVNEALKKLADKIENTAGRLDFLRDGFARSIFDLQRKTNQSADVEMAHAAQFVQASADIDALRKKVDDLMNEVATQEARIDRVLLVPDRTTDLENHFHQLDKLVSEYLSKLTADRDALAIRIGHGEERLDRHDKLLLAHLDEIRKLRNGSQIDGGHAAAHDDRLEILEKNMSTARRFLATLDDHLTMHDGSLAATEDRIRNLETNKGGTVEGMANHLARIHDLETRVSEDRRWLEAQSNSCQDNQRRIDLIAGRVESLVAAHKQWGEEQSLVNDRIDKQLAILAQKDRDQNIYWHGETDSFDKRVEEVENELAAFRQKVSTDSWEDAKQTSQVIARLNRLDAFFGEAVLERLKNVERQLNALEDRKGFFGRLSIRLGRAWNSLFGTFRMW